MPVGVTYRSGQAAKILEVSAHALRRLAEAGLVDAEYTGSQWRFPIEEIQRLQREGLPPLPAIEQDGLRSARRPQGSNRPVTEGLLAPPSEELVADAEDLERKKLELQKLDVRREIEEATDYFRAREQEAEDQEEQRRTRLQEQRHQQQRQQSQLQEQQRRQRWRSQWLEHALRSMPFFAPKDLKLQVNKHVSETLGRLSPSENRQVVRQLVAAATEKALKPWRRQQEIRKVIEDALPYEIKYSDDKPKALRAAAQAVRKLRPEATPEELQLAAKEAIQPFIIKQEHEKQCEEIIGSISSCLRGDTAQDREVGRNVVRAEIEKLPVGCGVEMMEQIRDQLLQHLQQIIDKRAEKAAVQRKKQEAQAQRERGAEDAKLRKQQEETRRKQEAEEAQRRKKNEAAEALRQAEWRLIGRLGHVHDYLGKLGQSEIEFASFLERWILGEKFKKKIEPSLINELVQNPDLTDEELHERVERLVDEHLPDELDEELEVDEAV